MEFPIGSQDGQVGKLLTVEVLKHFLVGLGIDLYHHPSMKLFNIIFNIEYKSFSMAIFSPQILELSCLSDVLNCLLQHSLIDLHISKLVIFIVVLFFVLGK